MNMPVCLSVWFALIVSSSCGTIGFLEEEGSTTYSPYEDSNVTATPEYDYDYNATFDYYYVTGNYSVIENVSDPPIVVVKEVPDLSAVMDPMSGCGSITDPKPFTRTLLMSLPAIFFGTLNV